jgi:two-component system CheB/CheR fusion protein
MLQHDKHVEALLEHLKGTRSFDFTGYKRTSLVRRIQRRMQEVNAKSFAEYLDYLEVHPEEFRPLFDTILINVTAFYRDPATWDYLSNEIIPRILAEKKPSDLIRIWSAGCASGEEVYTIAICMSEALGEPSLCRRVKIYCTDVDEESLKQARSGSFSEKQVKSLPERYLAKYFSKAGDRYVFNPELRRCIIIGRHDLIQDAPISRLDLLVCRNTLMYFNVETQRRILERFHFALKRKGFLFLGKAEMLLGHSGQFVPLELKHRIFAKSSQYEVHLMPPIQPDIGNEKGDPTSRQVLLERAFETEPAARLIVDANGIIAMANERARSTLGVNTRDIGRRFSDLEISYKPAELRSFMEEAYSDRRIISLPDVKRILPGGEEQHFSVELNPLRDSDGHLAGISVGFQEITNYIRIKTEHERVVQELETAYEELQSSNEELQTTNEELQSTNEELETTNEELQSTNEEMETMNEELQSTNAELQTLNEELQRQTDESNRANLHLESILGSLRAGVVVLDSKLKVERWNKEAESLWGLRADEACGHHFLGLDIGLPVEKLKRPLHASLKDPAPTLEVLLDATNRLGKQIKCRVTCSPLRDSKGIPRGVIMLMSQENPG